jgi:hypothetical protein
MGAESVCDTSLSAGGVRAGGGRAEVVIGGSEGPIVDGGAGVSEGGGSGFCGGATKGGGISGAVGGEGSWMTGGVRGDGESCCLSSLTPFCQTTGERSRSETRTGNKNTLAEKKREGWRCGAGVVSSTEDDRTGEAVLFVSS